LTQILEAQQTDEDYSSVNRPATAYWDSIQVEGESPMTMQVAMVGTDGIVLASDTKWTNQSGGAAFDEHSSKIRIDSTGKLAASLARNMGTSRAIAKAISEELSDADWINPCGRMEAVAREILTSATQKSAECLIASAHSSLRLFHLEVTTGDGLAISPNCREMQGKAIAGDRVNSSVFWSEMYYREGLPVKYLIPLAAHLILTAGRVGRGGIGGLEIAVCRDRGFARLPDEAISALQSDSLEWDRKVGDMFSGYVDKDAFDGVLRSMITSKPMPFRDAVAAPKPRKDGGIKRSAKKPSA
jgi:hypothetical protein